MRWFSSFAKPLSDRVRLRWLSRTLFPNHRTISDNVPGRVPECFHSFDADPSRDGLYDPQDILPDNSVILSVHNGCIHAIDDLVSFLTESYPSLMRQVLCWFVLEVDKTRGDKNKNEYQGDHHVIVKAATLVGPEDVTLDGAPHARHMFQSKSLPVRSATTKVIQRHCEQLVINWKVGKLVIW